MLTYEIVQTKSFSLWLVGLRDVRAKLMVGRRIERAVAGNLGDTKSLGGGIHEFRIDVSAGYRIYFTPRGVDPVIGRRR